MSVNYPGSPDPKLWVSRKYFEDTVARIGERIGTVERKLAAVAKDVTFTVALNKNGGSGDTMASKTVTALGSVTLDACTYTKEGKEFAGWNTKADGTGTAYADEATVEALDFADVTGNVTLYAQWADPAE